MHKAYRTLSLINHPDHNVESVHATEKFQVLVNVHDFLMCAENRKLYDETGTVFYQGKKIFQRFHPMLLLFFFKQFEQRIRN